MAERKIYFGSVGPFLFDDTDLIDDEDGDFAAETQQAVRTDGPIRTDHTPAVNEDMIRLVDLTSTLDELELRLAAESFYFGLL